MSDGALTPRRAARSVPRPPGWLVTAYRLYLLAKTGRILRAIDLMAEDDAQAIR